MPRIRVLTVMATVALVAAVAGGIREYQRLTRLSEQYKTRAIAYGRKAAIYRPNLTLTHAEWEANNREFEQTWGAMNFKPLSPSPEDCRLLLPYFNSLWRKYEHAAQYPWLAIEPDPPRPE